MDDFKLDGFTTLKFFCQKPIEDGSLDELTEDLDLVKWFAEKIS